MICPVCKKEVGNKFYKCPNCGLLLTHLKGYNKSNLKKNEKSSSNILVYLFSFFIPLVGIIVGSIYLSNDDKKKKGIGYYLIILSIIGGFISAYIIYNIIRNT